MNVPVLHVLRVGRGEDERAGGPGWLDWLNAHLDPAWRAGEWDPGTGLFTGDLDSDRTAAWPCRSQGCSTATRHHHGRCDGCWRARTTLGLCWEDFDATPPRRATRPLLREGCCAVSGCASELHSRGMCFRHERAWRRAKTEPIEVFLARTRALARGEDCLVVGCGREHVSRRGLCHDNRLLRRYDLDQLPAEQLVAWVAAERPRLGAQREFPS